MQRSQKAAVELYTGRAEELINLLSLSLGAFGTQMPLKFFKVFPLSVTFFLSAEVIDF